MKRGAGTAKLGMSTLKDKTFNITNDSYVLGVTAIVRDNQPGDQRICRLFTEPTQNTRP